MILLSSAIIFNILCAVTGYLAGLFTRAAIQAMQESRAQVMRHHFQNEHLDRVLYWKERGELFGHCCRKAWQRRLYDERVEIGYPVATAEWSVERLVEAGVVGLYGYRVE